MTHIITFLVRFLLGYLITIGAIFATQWTYYVYFDDFQPPVVEVPIRVTTPVIAKGDNLGLTLRYVKPEEIYISSVRQITCQDGDIYVLPQNTVQLPLSKEQRTVNITIPIPADVPIHGNQYCNYQVRGTGEVNPFKTYVTELISEPFYLED